MSRIKNKYQLVIGFLTGMGMAGFLCLESQQNCINRWKELAEKNRGLFLLMDQWVKVKQEGKKLEEYFIKNDYKKIAVYGMSYVGVRLVKELENSEIEIAYGIDRNAANIYSQIKLLTVEDELPDVDAVIVTLVGGYDKVFDMLISRLGCPIIALEDIVNEI